MLYGGSLSMEKSNPSARLRRGPLSAAAARFAAAESTVWLGWYEPDQPRSRCGVAAAFGELMGIGRMAAASPRRIPSSNSAKNCASWRLVTALASTSTLRTDWSAGVPTDARGERTGEAPREAEVRMVRERELLRRKRPSDPFVAVDLRGDWRLLLLTGLVVRLDFLLSLSPRVARGGLAEPRDRLFSFSRCRSGATTVLAFHAGGRRGGPPLAERTSALELKSRAAKLTSDLSPSRWGGRAGVGGAGSGTGTAGDESEGGATGGTGSAGGVRALVRARAREGYCGVCIRGGDSVFTVAALAARATRIRRASAVTKASRSGACRSDSSRRATISLANCTSPGSGPLPRAGRGGDNTSTDLRPCDDARCAGEGAPLEGASCRVACGGESSAGFRRCRPCKKSNGVVSFTTGSPSPLWGPGRESAETGEANDNTETSGGNPSSSPPCGGSKPNTRGPG